ncbi:MAG: FTR1 family protein [Parvibaculum sp.]|uniref:FTR1 family iron permease n=1 Tax=Parvibaculum sp. TaxID=2024848 RepID=UPI002842BEEC|nr:FTR1 family protein [Parvibaculum sp.]MDR3500470.1 FTR1 family protein [Parvibaculum sp.]
MLATLIIVFREVIEAALVISIVAAATKGISGRNRWLALGVGAGILGACLVAGFAGQIASSLEGSGQEIFNASILFLAVLMLGWHNIWMGSHGRELAAEMSAVGRDVMSGAKPLYAVAIAVGIAVLREGSEVALFLYGIAAGGGLTASGLLVGGAIGLVAGAALGYALYKGLVVLSTRTLFAVTSWMILLLAAGLAAQGANFLVQAGILSPLGEAMWDTSWLLSDQTIFGKMLHTLIGYTARPTPIQLIFYVATIVVIGGLMKIMSGAAPKKSAGVVAALAVTAVAAGLLPGGKAEAADLYIYSPYVEKGEAEVEYQGYRTFGSDPSKDNEQKQTVSFGYGVTDYWATEIGGNWMRDPGGKTHFDSTEWENRFQLTDQGEYFVDLGFATEYEHVRNRDGDSDEIDFGPVIAKDIGDTTTTANLIFERLLGPHADGGLGVTYRLQERWRLDEAFEPAIEAYGEFGRVNNLGSVDEQEHRAGPAIQGAVNGPNWFPGKFRYNVGYLFGLTSATARGTLKTVMEYELRF